MPVTRNDQRILKIFENEDHSISLVGRVDGIHADTIIESKNRQSKRTFGRGLTNYDRIQLVVYMAMFKYTKAKLIETFEGQQNDYDLDFKKEEWDTIQTKIIDTLRPFIKNQQ